MPAFGRTPNARQCRHGYRQGQTPRAFGSITPAFLAAFAGRVTIDLGTGDGRLPCALAPASPERLFVGIDASAAGLRQVSVRAARSGLTNVLYVRSAVEALPPELAGVADRVIAILPWGSLLAALARPVVPVLRRAGAR